MMAAAAVHRPSPVPDTLAAVLVNYAGWRRTASCARWLEADGLPPERIVVVDNGSRDGSAERLRALLPGAPLHACAENRGFASGCNLGVETALRDGAEAVLLLNPDTVALPGFLARLAESAGPLTEACASPEVFLLARPDRSWYAGAWRGRVPGTFVARAAGDPRRAVDYVWACCLLIGRSVWERVGSFDPIYFLFYEDMDWCERAARHGVAPQVAPEARLWHGVATSSEPAGSDRMRTFRRYHMSRSGVLFDRRRGHVPPAIGGSVRLAVAARTASGLAIRGDRAGLVAHWRGHRDGWRLTLPPPPRQEPEPG